MSRHVNTFWEQFLSDLIPVIQPLTANDLRFFLGRQLTKVIVIFMPALGDQLPQISRKSLVGRANRAAKVKFHTRQVWTGSQICQIRKEVHHLQKRFWEQFHAEPTVAENGQVFVPDWQGTYAALCRARQMILELIGYPRRPQGKLENDQQRGVLLAATAVIESSPILEMDSKSPTQESKSD